MAHYPHYRVNKPAKKKFRIIENTPNEENIVQKSHLNVFSEKQPSNPFDVSKRNVSKSVSFVKPNLRSGYKQDASQLYEQKDTSFVNQDEIQRIVQEKPLRNNAMRIMGAPNVQNNIFNQSSEEPQFFQTPNQKRQIIRMQNQHNPFQQNYINNNISYERNQNANIQDYVNNNISHDQQMYNQYEQNQQIDNPAPYEINQNRINSANYENAKIYHDSNTKMLRPWLIQQNS